MNRGIVGLTTDIRIIYWYMKPEQAAAKFRDFMRLKHLAISTEQCYLAWLDRYMRFLAAEGGRWGSSEERVQAFLTGLAHREVSASTQNQAFNALVMFYREVVGQPLAKVEALRAKAPVRLREAPSVAETRAIQQAMGHASLETTMGYLHAEALSVPSPLEVGA